MFGKFPKHPAGQQYRKNMKKTHYRIGEFSKLAKITVKTLRYYDEMDILRPCYVDPETGYRYYQTEQLIHAQKITEFRQLGLSIDEIQRIQTGGELQKILIERKASLQMKLEEIQRTSSRINSLLKQLKESQTMKYQAVLKILPSAIVYSKRGIVADFSKISEFVLQTGEECLAANPGLKCPEPGYCYISYLDGEYRDHDIQIEYVEAVNQMGKNTETINFKKIEETQAICIIHQGEWEKLGEAYAFALKWIEENGYEMSELPRECYIDGPWNKESPSEYITELQFPVK